MAYRLSYSQQAGIDLREVLEWYAFAPKAVTDRLEREFSTIWEHLAEFPYLGHERVTPWRTISLTRFPYTVWYRVSVSAEVIRVSRILHDRRSPTVWPG